MVGASGDAIRRGAARVAVQSRFWFGGKVVISYSLFRRSRCVSAPLHPKLGSWSGCGSLVRTRRPNRRFASFARCAQRWRQVSVEVVSIERMFEKLGGAALIDGIGDAARAESVAIASRLALIGELDALRAVELAECRFW